MSTKASPVIIIPARMAANRLPGKPLADIAGKPMICHVWERAMSAAVAPVWVATDDAEIAAVVRNAGGEAVLTRVDHPSGSDRTFEAVSLIDPDGQYNLVLNLQGDLPEMDQTIPLILLRTAMNSGADLTTLVTQAEDEEVARDQVVKAVVSWDEIGNVGRALYFSRSAVPHGDAPKWHHVGVYGWRRQALERFVTLPPSPLEQSERLEQLRVLEAGMHIAVAAVDKAPAGVDTPEDLEATRARLFAATGR